MYFPFGFLPFMFFLQVLAPVKDVFRLRHFRCLFRSYVRTRSQGWKAQLPLSICIQDHTELGPSGQRNINRQSCIIVLWEACYCRPRRIFSCCKSARTQTVFIQDLVMAQLITKVILLTARICEVDQRLYASVTYLHHIHTPCLRIIFPLRSHSTQYSILKYVVENIVNIA